MKMLIIDDDITLLQSVAMLVEALGAEADTAAGAEQAARMMEDRSYDFVLLDMRMPDGDGLWFMRHARIPRGTRVILMSGFVPALLLKEMFRLGVRDYLEKPFDSQDLLDVVDRQSRSGAGHTALAAIAA